MGADSRKIRTEVQFVWPRRPASRDDEKAFISGRAAARSLGRT